MSVILDETLLKMAEAEVLRDAKKAQIRHSFSGLYGRQQSLKLNKVFLANTVLQVLINNTARSHKGKKPSVKHKSTKRKLMKKGEKIFTFQTPKNNKNKIGASKSKKDNKEKLGHSSSDKVTELNNATNKKDQKQSI